MSSADARTGKPARRLCPVTSCAFFNANTPALNGFADAGTIMPLVKLRASTILSAFEQAQSELVGKAVVLTDGKAGTVESVWLDELHGLRISVKGHDGRWPVSTVKFAEN